MNGGKSMDGAQMLDFLNKERGETSGGVSLPLSRFVDTNSLLPRY